MPAHEFLARLTLEQSPHSTSLLKQGPDPPVGLCERQPLWGPRPIRVPVMATLSLLLAALSAAVGATQSAVADPALAGQLARGEDIYFADCAMCHNDDLSGGALHSAPPLAGDAFLMRWNGRSARDLLELARLTMPEGQPRSLDDQSYLDVIAFVLVRNRIALRTGALTEIGASQIPLH